LKVPSLQGSGGAYYDVPGFIKVDESLRNRERNSKRRCQHSGMRGLDT